MLLVIPHGFHANEIMINGEGTHLVCVTFDPNAVGTVDPFERPLAKWVI